MSLNRAVNCGRCRCAKVPLGQTGRRVTGLNVGSSGWRCPGVHDRGMPSSTTHKSTLLLPLLLLPSTTEDMSIEQYTTLAVQEQSHPETIASRLAHWWRMLTSSGNTPLERLLLEDSTTFTSKLTAQYGSHVALAGIGEVFYVDVPGPGDQSPIVLFIHGIGGNLQQFDYQIEECSKFTRVIALDLSGSGQSSYVPAFKLTLDNFALSVEALLKRLKAFDQEIILVGHSYGSQVCIKLVQSLPQVTSLTLLAPPKVGFKRKPLQTLMLRIFLNVPWAFQLFRKIDRVNNIHSHSLKRLFANETEASEFNKFKQFKFNISTNSHNVLTHALSWSPLPVEELLEVYSTLQQQSKPFVVIDGTDDKVTHLGGATYRDLLGSHIDYIKLEKTGHNMMLEHPEEMNGVLRHVLVKSNVVVG